MENVNSLLGTLPNEKTADFDSFIDKNSVRRRVHGVSTASASAVCKLSLTKVRYTLNIGFLF